jgi:hypothetical protein
VSHHLYFFFCFASSELPACLAVITAQRSLDLQCTNEIARDVWATGLQRVLVLWREDRLHAFSKLSFT